MKQKLTSIPAHYRPLGDNEKIRVGDLYYCTLDKQPIITRISRLSNLRILCTPAQWLEYKFFRRKHVPTNRIEVLPPTPTRIALNDSVNHWDRFATGKSNEGESTGCKDCALCQMFFKKNGTCDGCPVANFTGFQHCEGSPYPPLSRYESKNSPRFKAAAAKFRDWLKQLPVDDENV